MQRLARLGRRRVLCAHPALLVVPLAWQIVREGLPEELQSTVSEHVLVTGRMYLVDLLIERLEPHRKVRVGAGAVRMRCGWGRR